MADFNVQFTLLSPYPKLEPQQAQTSLAAYRGKPLVVHLYTG